MVLIAIDLETTGLDPERDSIISIGASGQRETIVVHTDPGGDLGPSHIHGFKRNYWGQLELNGEVVADVSLTEAMEQLKDFILEEWKDRGHPVVLVAHKGHEFDFPFLMRAMDTTGVYLPWSTILADSLVMARNFYNRGSNNNLATLRKHHLEKSTGPIHFANEDAEDLIEIIIGMAAESKFGLFKFIRNYDRTRPNILRKVYRDFTEDSESSYNYESDDSYYSY